MLQMVKIFVYSSSEGDVGYTILDVTNFYSLITNKNQVQIKSQRFSFEVNFASQQPGK